MMCMKEQNVFELIRTVEQFSSEMIIRWSRMFPQNVGLSPILVLFELQQNGPRKHSELANSLGYTAGALTNIANRLIKSGYANRKRDEDDRRIVRLELTDIGEDLLKEAQLKGQELRKEVFEQLSQEELNQFLDIHKKLLNHLENIE